ncbi:MAG: serine hydroxymethyltransferase [Rickettsiales bacterium]|nr:serine hydroxymethyltransferase [Rickettsiales bacterium]
MSINFIFEQIEQERKKLNETCELIASENYPSPDVLRALGSVLSVKYAEGYPEHRHYAGCNIIDNVENRAVDAAKKLFGAKFANVQPWSGSQANMAALYAFCNPSDTILSLDLNEGAHLTHGSPFTFSGKYFHHESFHLGPDEKIDYENIRGMLAKTKPKILIAGTSAYPREIDFAKIRTIIDEYNKAAKQKCFYMVDMAHIAGLVAAGEHISPVPYADIITSTSHKTLRGPRGGFILWNDDSFTKKINQAVFPAIQGGPNAAAIAAKAICFEEAMNPSFPEYAKNIKTNIIAILDGIKETAPNIRIVSGGTDTHLLLLDLKPVGIDGGTAEKLLEDIGIITNKNMISGDTSPPKSSGIRLGSAAMTSRNLSKTEFQTIGNIIGRRLMGGDMDLKNEVMEIIKRHPVY